MSAGRSPEALVWDLMRGALTARAWFVRGSYFEPVPEGDVYVLGTVLHDWDDDSAARILQTVRRAAHGAHDC